MVGFIKNRTTFVTTGKANIIDMRIVESDTGDTSSVTVPAGSVVYGNRGDWFVVDGCLFVISEVSPGETTTAVTLSDFASAFSAPFVASTAASTEAYVAALLNSIKTDADEMYARGYMSVTTSGSSSFVPPSVDGDGVFDLADYIRTLASLYGIRITPTIDGDTLRIVVSRRSAVERTVIIGRRCQLVAAPVFSAASTAKIITLPSGTAYYLKTDGSFSTSPSGSRAFGKIKVINTDGKTEDEVLAAVAEEFNSGAGEHKIEWMSDDDYDIGDVCSFRINGGLYRGTIVSKTRMLNDSRFAYRSGELAVTLTDKLKEVRG